MKQTIIALSLVGAAFARPGVNTYSFEKREVPQEHAHRNVNLIVNKSLNANNPDKIGDPIFGLLGAKAAAEGAGNIADPDCLQQATADQAFTNAKAAGDVNGMTFAMIYRALERNSGSVGLASVPCTTIKAVNPEIAALQQHQDPASAGAAALNKQIATTLAAQIGAIGGDPTLANEASTFAPGKLGDPTAKGNTCDDSADDKGCINTLGLRVDDLTQAEALAAASGGAGTGTGAAAGNGTANAGAGNGNGNGKGKANQNAGAAAGNAAAGNAACDANAGAAAGNANAGAAAGNANAGAAAGNAGAAAGNANAGNANSGQAGAAAGNANAGNANTGNAAAGAATGAAGAATGFGSCTDPSIKFTQTPSDGRKEAAFEATDLTNFPHGSALGIGVISAFICDQLTNKCKAGQAAVDKCDQADAAVKASGLKGQAAADSFNKALGL